MKIKKPRTIKNILDNDNMLLIDAVRLIRKQLEQEKKIRNIQNWRSYGRRR